MKKHLGTLAGPAVGATTLHTLPALATHGCFAHGDGLKAKGMGGAATALAQDSVGGANNAANVVWAGSRVDLGLDWFRPEPSAQRTDAGFDALNGSVDSGSRNFQVPELGVNEMLDPALALGVSVDGNGGLNTDYNHSGFNCGGAPTCCAAAASGAWTCPS